jgi:hypothetical protein
VSQSVVKKAKKTVTVDRVFPWNGLRELQALSRQMLVVVKIVVNGKKDGSLCSETPLNFWVPPTGFEPVIFTLKG